MISLHDMLIKEGFNDYRKIKSSKKKLIWKDQTSTVMMCTEIRHERIASFDSEESVSATGKFRSYAPPPPPPPIDEVAIRAVISIMSGYIEQYLKDENFRRSIRAKCYACLPTMKEFNINGGITAQLETTIENIEKLVEQEETRRKTRLNSLQCSIRLLSIVAELNSKNSRNEWTRGIPNSHLSAIAQLYLAIVYGLERNGRISAMHLLQVFIDAPLLARIHLIPQLWENLLLPHLLHLKIWHDEEVESVRNSKILDKEIKINDLNEVYDAQMDIGTVKFAVYFKEWLKVGVQAPAFPALLLPVTKMDLQHISR